MRLLRDPFLNSLLVALAVYATLIGLWMHSPAVPPPRTAIGGSHACP